MKNKKEYIWALIGKFIPQIMNLATTMALTRILSPDDFGMIGVLSVFFAVSNVLMDSGLGGSLIKENSISKLDCSTIFVFNVVMGLILYFTLFILSDKIELYFSKDGLSDVVKILCLVFILNSLGLVSKSLLVRELKFRFISNVNIVSVFFSSIFAIILGIYGFEVYALVYSQLINSFVCVLLFIWKSNSWMSIRFSIDSFKRLMPFGFFTTLITIIDTFYENILTFLFGKYYNMSQAGYLSQAKRVEEVPSNSLIVTINSVSFPVLSKLKTNQKEFINEADKILLTLSTIIIPLILITSLFSRQIVILLFGTSWIDSAYYLSVLMFAGIFILLENINRNFIKSLGLVDVLFKYTIIKRVIGIATILIVGYISIDYVLYAYIFSSFIGFFINSHIYCKVTKQNNILYQWHFFRKVVFPNSIYYLLMYFVVTCLDAFWCQLFIMVLLFSLYYIYAIKLLGIKFNGLLYKRYIN